MLKDAVDTVQLDDDGWQTERDAIAFRFFGVQAEEFIERFQAGEYDDADELMAVLAYFPELD